MSGALNIYAPELPFLTGYGVPQDLLLLTIPSSETFIQHSHSPIGVG